MMQPNDASSLLLAHHRFRDRLLAAEEKFVSKNFFDESRAEDFRAVEWLPKNNASVVF
jgi:hypothetical protein